MNNVIDGIYYTPKHIADMAAGSGGFMKQAFDLTQNPPYSTRKEKTVKIADWDWNKALPVDIFYNLVFSGFPGWEKPDGKNPAIIEINTISGKTKSSRDIAIEFDDIAIGNFYYRDVTPDRLPFTKKGDSYISFFYFQFIADAIKFKELYKTS